MRGLALFVLVMALLVVALGVLFVTGAMTPG